MAETTQAVPIPLGLEFTEHNPDEIPYDDKVYYLENFASSVSDTFDETSDSHPLLKYKNLLPISVHIRHSSFGSEIRFQPEI